MKTASSLRQLGITKQDRVLICMPHPDDEAAFSAGLITLLTQSNLLVEVVTFTHGEVSTLRYGLADADDLGSVREHELVHAMQVLGVPNHQLLDFGDGQLKHKTSKMTAWIAHKLKTSGFTILVTLEPDGIYGHPDHIALSSSCLTATTSLPCKLLYATVTPNFIQPGARRMAVKEIIEPIKPQYVLKLTLRMILTKLKALNAHTSQLKLSLAQFKTYSFFWKNRMFTHEYFAYSRT